LAGAAAATIDILFAFVFYGLRVDATPLRVLQSIASGLFGRASFEGGIATAAAGLVAHYVILIVAAWWYYLAALRLRALTAHPVTFGALYGVVIYFVMHLVVVPLSAAPAFKFNFVNQACEFFNHGVLGIAISLIVARGIVRRL
ncbi:MAG TPA: hypothetical protein VF132_14840, partial [Rudaea sp.]